MYTVATLPLPSTVSSPTPTLRIVGLNPPERNATEAADDCQRIEAARGSLHAFDTSR